MPFSVPPAVIFAPSMALTGVMMYVATSRFRLLLVEAHPGHFRVGKSGPGNYGVIYFETPETAEQGVHRGVPGLVARHMSELVRAGSIAAGIDAVQAGAQVSVHLDGAIRVPFNTGSFEPGTAACCSTHGLP